MNKLNKNYDDYQEIEVIDKKLIEDFLNTHFKLWEQDILKFENFKEYLTKDNINKIYFYSYISLSEDLEYQIVFNDETTKNFYLDKETIYNWLVKHNLID